MANKKPNIDFLNDLKPVDNLFREEVHSDELGFLEISAKDLTTHHNHSYKVRDDDEMRDLVESIKENGVITPLVVRNLGDKYEIISGHRRKHAAQIAGIEKVPCVIIDVDDDTSDIMMVDSNYQREVVLPSEKAFSYKVKYEAMKRQGQRSGDTDEGRSLDQLGEESDDSASQIYRYIKLTELQPELLDMVDNGNIKFLVGVSIASFDVNTQKNILSVINDTGKTISLNDAKTIKTKADKKTLSKDEILNILNGDLKPRKREPFKFNEKMFNQHVPENIKKIPSSMKVDYQIRALEIYDEYLKEHPDELERYS